MRKVTARNSLWYISKYALMPDALERLSATATIFFIKDGTLQEKPAKIHQMSLIVQSEIKDPPHSKVFASHGDRYLRIPLDRDPDGQVPNTLQAFTAALLDGHSSAGDPASADTIEPLTSVRNEVIYNSMDLPEDVPKSVQSIQVDIPLRCATNSADQKFRLKPDPQSGLCETASTRPAFINCLSEDDAIQWVQDITNSKDLAAKLTTKGTTWDVWDACMGVKDMHVSIDSQKDPQPTTAQITCSDQQDQPGRETD